jgi:hypothetical protein
VRDGSRSRSARSPHLRPRGFLQAQTPSIVAENRRLHRYMIAARAAWGWQAKPRGHWRRKEANDCRSFMRPNGS